MQKSISITWDKGKGVKDAIAWNSKLKLAYMKGCKNAVDELAEIGMEEVRKSQSYHATEKLQTKIVGRRVIGGYENKTKGITYAEYGTGTRSTYSHNPYASQIKGKDLWFTTDPRVAKYTGYIRKVNKFDTPRYSAGTVYYIVFPQKAQRRFFFAKQRIDRRRRAVVDRNIRHALKEVR